VNALAKRNPISLIWGLRSLTLFDQSKHDGSSGFAEVDLERGSRSHAAFASAVLAERVAQLNSKDSGPWLKLALRSAEEQLEAGELAATFRANAAMADQVARDLDRCEAAATTMLECVGPMAH